MRSERERDGEQERGVLDRVERMGLEGHREEVARDRLHRLRAGGQPDVAREHLEATPHRARCCSCSVVAARSRRRSAGARAWPRATVCALQPWAAALARSMWACAVLASDVVSTATATYMSWA